MHAVRKKPEPPGKSPRKTPVAADEIESAIRSIEGATQEMVQIVATMRSLGIDKIPIDGAQMPDRALKLLRVYVQKVRLELARRA
jgi:hypothetical protein